MMAPLSRQKVSWHGLANAIVGFLKEISQSCSSTRVAFDEPGHGGGTPTRELRAVDIEKWLA